MFMAPPLFRVSFLHESTTPFSPPQPVPSGVIWGASQLLDWFPPAAPKAPKYISPGQASPRAPPWVGNATKWPP